MRRCPTCRASFRANLDRCPRDRTELVARDVDPLIDRVLGDRYRIESLLGTGGMGLVYRAEHTKMPRALAVKVLYGELASDAEMTERFRREAQAMSVLNHPNIASIVDFGESEAGLPYLVMELVEGESLSSLIERTGALDPAFAASITRQIARGLAEAHGRNIVHRDLKPHNIMLVPRTNELPAAKILDFGIARIVAPEGPPTPGTPEPSPDLTATGTFFGTPCYMAPEQFDGIAVDARADLYSLGIILFEMLMGEPPFRGNAAELAFRQAASPPPRITRGDPRLRAIAQRLLSKKPDQRHRSAIEVVDALDALSMSDTPAPPPEPTTTTGEAGRYELLEQIGQGGMGAVYKARDPVLDRIVALKFLQRVDKPEQRERFRREARIVARLDHPHIAEVYELSEDPPFIAMQYVDGQPIHQAHGDRIRALRDTARAIHYAHRRGVLHRDLKPANILVDANGHAFVLDFGIAKELSDESRLTHDGALRGTPAYMAPEQALGRTAQIDARTDVYGLGATLYELLAGVPPHSGASAYEVVHSVIERDPKRPPGNSELATIALHAMARDPAARYPSALAFAEDLDRFLEKKPIAARPPALIYRARKALVRRPLASALAACSVLAIAVALWTVFAAASSVEPWVTVFSDDFSSAAPGPEWRGLRGTLRVHDGALCSANGHVVHTEEFGDRVRMTYSARVPADSALAREMSAFVSGSAKSGLADGYSAEFFMRDAQGRAFHGLQRGRAVAERAKALEPELNRRYELSVSRDGPEIEMHVDGARVLSFRDPAPFAGQGHEQVGFGSKCDHLHIDDVEVSVPLGRARVIAGRAIEQRAWSRADRVLGEVIAVERDPLLRASAELLRLRALLRLEKREDAEALRARIDTSLLTDDRRIQLSLDDAELEVLRGNSAGALQKIGDVAKANAGRREAVDAEVQIGCRRALARGSRDAIARALENVSLQLCALDLLHARLSLDAPESGAVPLDTLPEWVQPIAATAYGLAPAKEQYPTAQRLGVPATRKRWLAEYEATTGLWAVKEGRRDEALEWFARSDHTISALRPEPSELATFGLALLEPARAAARLRSSAAELPAQLAWRARTELLLGRDEDALGTYRALDERWPNRPDIPETWEAGVITGRITPEDAQRAIESGAPEIPRDYAAHFGVFIGIRDEREGRREEAERAYRSAGGGMLPVIALRLLAEQRLGR